MKTNNPKWLRCSCCGSPAFGRQYHNQDTGYSVCTKCADWIAGREGEEYLTDCHGKRGHNFAVIDELAVQS